MRPLLLFLPALLFVFPASASIQLSFDYRIFHVPGEGPYVEVSTSFQTDVMQRGMGSDGREEWAAGLTLIFLRSGEVAAFRKVTVSSPTEGVEGPLLSLERFALPNGTYTLELSAMDQHEPDAKPVRYVQEISIDNLSEGAFISDIAFISAYTPTTESNAFSKSGYDLLPYVSSHFPSELKQLVFYAEIYQTHNYFGEGQPFVSVVCITDAMNREIETCKRMKREKAAPVIPLLQTVDLSDLPTGEYRLKVEIRDRENKTVVSRERRFTRNQQVPVSADPTLVSDEVLRLSWVAGHTDRDSLLALLQAHLPVAQNVERNTIDYQLPGGDLRMLQSFFYSFWLRRNPGDPESAWREYEKQLLMVESNFATKIRKGWQTDRGRVYLQYGPPSTRVVRNHDPDYWPFEIWHYYETNTGLHDRRFLFYNTSLNFDFELLHSDVPDEVQNNDWVRLVRAREGNTPGSIGRNTNNQMVDPYSGDELMDLWYNPH